MSGGEVGSSMPSDWNHEILAAIAHAREIDDDVPFTWDGVGIRVHPGDEAVDVRARWRSAKHDADRGFA